MPILKPLLDFFSAKKTTYSHRNRTIEIIATEKGIDIGSIKAETKAILEKEGSVEAVVKLRKRFHVTDAAAWNFVEKLDPQLPGKDSRTQDWPEQTGSHPGGVF